VGAPGASSRGITGRGPRNGGMTTITGASADFGRSAAPELKTQSGCRGRARAFRFALRFRVSYKAQGTLFASRDAGRRAYHRFRGSGSQKASETAGNPSWAASQAEEEEGEAESADARPTDATELPFSGVSRDSRSQSDLFERVSGKPEREPTQSYRCVGTMNGRGPERPRSFRLWPCPSLFPSRSHMYICPPRFSCRLDRYYYRDATLSQPASCSPPMWTAYTLLHIFQLDDVPVAGRVLIPLALLRATTHERKRGSSKDQLRDWQSGMTRRVVFALLRDHLDGRSHQATLVR
jgi:hypothetical protein